MRRPSPVTKNPAFAVRSGPTSRNGRLDLLDWQWLLAGGRRVLDRRYLPVCGIAARLAQDEHVLTGGVQDHELVGLAPAHDPNVARHHDGFKPKPLERSDVRSMLRLVAGIEACLVGIAAVGVLHHELANANEAAPGSRLIPPLRLEVVDHHRQLAIRLDDVGEEQCDDLFVSHREDHVPSAAVLEPAQLRPNRLVAAARPPDISWMDDRHFQLLAADAVLLLADDLFDAIAHPLSERQERVDP
jgi:hypothetical protein